MLGFLLGFVLGSRETKKHNKKDEHYDPYKDIVKKSYILKNSFDCGTSNFNRELEEFLKWERNYLYENISWLDKYPDLKNFFNNLDYFKNEYVLNGKDCLIKINSHPLNITGILNIKERLFDIKVYLELPVTEYNKKLINEINFFADGNCIEIQNSFCIFCSCNLKLKNKKEEDGFIKIVLFKEVEEYDEKFFRKIKM